MEAGGFFSLAAAYPDREVWIDAAGTAGSAGDLLAKMNQTSRGLRDLGLVPGDTVAVILSNRREFLECYGAAIQAGLFFVAVNWHLNPSEMSYILSDSKAKVIFTESRFAAAAVNAAAAANIDRRAVFAVDEAAGLRLRTELLEDQSAENLPDRSAGQIMFFTSGTTGRPKGVRKSFRADASDQLTLTSGIGAIGRASNQPASVTDKVFLSSGPFYHALPIAGVTTALDSGGVVVVMDKWTPEEFLQLVERYGVTDATVVPTMLHRLLALPEEVRRTADVSSLRAVNHAGAPCPVDVKRRIIDWWGPIVTESYSATEGAGTTVTSEEWLRKPGTVGRPSPGVKIKIIGEDGNERPIGEQGLVYLTPTLWDFEYHNDSDKTQSSRRAGMFTVGDIGYLDDDGYLFLCDRQANTINSGGVNIYPAEIEAILLQHAAVSDVAVIGIPNAEWGEEVRAVVEVRGSDGTADLETELIEFCQARVARFKCPKGVDFVESLERDPNGKLRKGVIRAKYWPDANRRI
ncbi:AMP-binding protein [Jatrophihabitans sp. DSM 45814]